MRIVPSPQLTIFSFTMGNLSLTPASQAEKEMTSFQAGDEITLEIPVHGKWHGFYGGIRDDGGQVLFLLKEGKLVRCYWPVEEVEMLRITPRKEFPKPKRKKPAKK